MPSRPSRKSKLDPSIPVEAAELASLRHVSDDTPGITRHRSGRGFSYHGVNGGVIKDRAVLARIRSLAIPPAWTDVWICPSTNGHIQATGRDARGRKQYRYHERWKSVRDENKFNRVIEFGRALPTIRQAIAKDLARPGLPIERALATVVWLLESTFIRIGGREYARDNDSFGLTTMLNRHVNVDGSEIRFRFRGKSGKDHTITIKDRRIARLVKQCRELPGQTLFQYLDEDDNVRAIDAGDVNTYLREIAGPEFTAKDFRTWGGTLLAAQQLSANEGSVPNIIAAVSKILGNTAAVCRKSYIHPVVLTALQDDAERERWEKTLARVQEEDNLTSDESALILFLKEASA